MLWTNVSAQNSLVSISVQNDIFNLVNQTDRYFTNGVDIRFYSVALNNAALNKVLVGGFENTTQISGLRLEQNIFTPIDIYTSELQIGDRPYASTLLLSFERVSSNRIQNYRVKSAAGIGLIGEKSGGQLLQNLVHTLSPYSDNANGWEHQISHDLLLNYSLQIEKGLINYNGFQFSLLGDLEAGTLINQASTGVGLSLGLFDHYFSQPAVVKSSKDFSARIYGSWHMQYVVYDATLQGGLFNSNSTYTIAQNDVNSERMTYSFGLQMGYRNLILEAGRTWQSEVFVGAKDHAWGFLKVIWLIN